jgi:hypothetical protein
MKRVTMNILLFVLPAALAVSCKPTLKVSSDYDRQANFSGYKTFSLFYLATNKNVTELNAGRIWNSVRAEMIRKGYTETYTNPDLLVNAVSVVKNKQHVGATSGSYGYAGPFRPYGGMVTTQTTFQSYNYKDGSLMIDVVDAKARKLVWQGAVNAELTKQPKNPDEAIQKAVSRTMASFPAGANGFN